MKQSNPLDTQRVLGFFSYFATLSVVSAWLLLPTYLASKPVVFATDIGGDVDDTWALAHILRSKELDLKIVLTETGEAEYRARVAAKVLQVAEREDVTIALGKDFGIMPDSERHQGPWVKNFKLSDYKGPINQDGVRAFINFVESSKETVTVIAVGPVPSLAAAIEQRPEIAKKCNFFGMFGSFYSGYDGSKEISAEYNVANNVKAFRTVIGADWRSITLTPLDTCGIFFL
ncbi:MAG: nucleoside hydrolase, partial [Verrucomicrobiota bacterium]|nr:nucleoside hydrolase [Verrucomicrobiota bacterium]